MIPVQQGILPAEILLTALKQPTLSDPIKFYCAFYFALQIDLDLKC